MLAPSHDPKAMRECPSTTCQDCPTCHTYWYIYTHTHMIQQIILAGSSAMCGFVKFITFFLVQCGRSCRKRKRTSLELIIFINSLPAGLSRVSNSNTTPQFYMQAFGLCIKTVTGRDFQRGQRLARRR